MDETDTDSFNVGHPLSWGGNAGRLAEQVDAAFSQARNPVGKADAQHELDTLSSIFQEAPVGLAILETPDHIFVLTNASYLSLLSENNRNLLGKPVRIAIPEAVKQGFVSLLDQVYETGQPYVGTEIPIDLQQSDESFKRLYLNFVYQPIRDARGQIYGIAAIVVDVTLQVVTRKELEAAILTAELDRVKFESIFADASTSMALTRGPNHIYDYINPSYQNLFIDRPLLGLALLDALPELEGQPFPKLFDRVLATGDPYVEQEARALLRRTEGGPFEERFFDQTYTRICDGSGQPYGVYIHAVEVTEKVLARRRLQESESQLKLATEAARLGSWSLDLESSTGYLSERASEIFGLAHSPSLRLEDLLERIHAEDRLNFAAAMRDQSTLSSTVFDKEIRILWRDGSMHWVQASALRTAPSLDDSAKRSKIAGTFLDLTDRVLAQHELRHAKENAEKANAAKTVFLAHMSHEIRTPLGAIMGFIKILRDETLAPDESREILTILDRNSQQLMSIIDDILDLSKVEAGMLLVETLEFSLSALLAEVRILFSGRAEAKGISFELVADTALPNVVISDPTRLRQILINIVGNAIKFTEKGRVVLKIGYCQESLFFEVSDTGPGISHEQRQRLFKAFSQGDVSVTRQFGGTGLGLVLTRKLSEALGGEFYLKESTVGLGSTFVARVAAGLPEGAQIEALQHLQEVDMDPRGSEVNLQGISILLVEDMPDNQALLSRLLRNRGARVDIVSNGALGVDLATKGSYSVVLMDVQMPVMDGITAVKLLRSLGYRTPVVALTAHAMKEERVNCLSAGFSDFLSKPIQTSDLLSLLDRLPRT